MTEAAKYNHPDAFENGAFNGDAYFGDPVDSTRATHIWRGGKWIDVGEKPDCCVLNIKWGLDCPKHKGATHD